ncbi:type VI secretion system baseplate subunit TssG [Halodesulfovibrio aestuarii]|uniref:type VI secretion system baseplate subunit TssG n=1 Tax=Halodesulfovibrio aestuarii TaxID=126333 RepID=UPI00040C446F
MGFSDGNAAVDLREYAQSGALPDNVRSYNFYQLVELLHKLDETDPEDEGWEYTCKLLFSSSSSMGFAASDVSRVERIDDAHCRLETTFLGLSGSQSPLPGFFLEQIATEGDEGLRKEFLDFFNHRLVSLVYRIWRKYRYYIRFEANAADAFSSQLFALVGLADDTLRSETSINWCKMLAYAGMLAGRSRSPQVVSGIIAHCFDLPDVTIKQWQVRKVTIPVAQRMSLGKRNSFLGQDTVIGCHVQDCTGKFVICLRELTLERFRDFLPIGRDFQTLCTLVEFILREQMAYDLELELKPDEAFPMCLDKTHGALLGWSSFMGDVTRNRRVRIQIRL